ncbi:hypothetical protein SAFG77S_02908 [Streptomyces afghaniensis]
MGERDGYAYAIRSPVAREPAGAAEAGESGAAESGGPSAGVAAAPTRGPRTVTGGAKLGVDPCRDEVRHEIS